MRRCCSVALQQRVLLCAVADAARSRAQFAGPEPSLERAFRGHRGGVAGLAFNPNMRQLVSAGLDGDVLVWNFKPSLRAYRFAGHTARPAPRGCRLGAAGRVLRVRTFTRD